MVSRRPGVATYPPGAVAALLRELDLSIDVFRSSSARLLERADRGAPMMRAEAARLEKAILACALGAERVDHRSGRYPLLRNKIRSALRPLPFELC